MIRSVRALLAGETTAMRAPGHGQLAAENGIDTARYEGLNNGQWRMNIGNKLRGALKGGKDVTIGKRTFRAEDMAVN